TLSSLIDECVLQTQPDMITTLNRELKKLKNENKARPGRPPRPPNAFILYRTSKCASMNVGNDGIPNNEVSKIIGEMWMNEPPEEKQKWHKLAESKKQEHAKQHPDYRYRPRRSCEKRRRTKRSDREKQEMEKNKITKTKTNKPKELKPAISIEIKEEQPVETPMFTPPILEQPEDMNDANFMNLSEWGTGSEMPVDESVFANEYSHFIEPLNTYLETYYPYYMLPY
ncbi:16035_t:CDS:1, partial [Dentiscutata erythropus]